jgi:phage tail P2-like protein
MSTSSILPDNRTLLETALEKTISQSLLNIDAVYPELWDSFNTPLHLLPYLAQAKGVPDWGNDTEQSKRQTVDDIWIVQRKAGTRSAVKQAVDALGFDASVKRGDEPYHLKVDLWREDVATLEPDILSRAKRRIDYVKSERDVIDLTLNATSQLDLYVALSSGAAVIATSFANFDDGTDVAINTAVGANSYQIQSVAACYIDDRTDLASGVAINSNYYLIQSVTECY